MSAVQPPSFEELAVLVVHLRAEVAALRADNERSRAENAELHAQLGKNSRNSSKAPSSDGPAEPALKWLRQRGGRKPGGRPGRPGTMLCRAERRDWGKRHRPARCRGCGAGLVRAGQAGMERGQVFGIPPIHLKVTEYQVIKRRCDGCGTVTTADAPAEVEAPVPYGPNGAAIVVYLYVYFYYVYFYVGQLLSKDSTACALAELFGTRSSPVTVATVTERAAATLTQADGFCEQVRDLGSPPPRRHVSTRPVIDHHFRAGGEGSWCRAEQAAAALREMKRRVDHAFARDGTFNTRAVRQQRGRTRDPQDQSPMEDLRLPAHTGAEQFCAIRSYPATTAKHGLGLLDALTRLTNRRPWLPSAT